ncbi:MAG: DNA photolyase family protein [Gammaproteobacteria bacterium]|jgi:deoxyribodipyrimidine photo-lyase|nr:DNA photolyase family protein [Gammaproteobacteria bacterium]
MASLLVSGSNTMQPVILWFRRNLRLADNAALQAAVEAGCPIIPLYIHDEEDRGSASRWWLHHSLTNLERDLRKLGASLLLRSGDPRQILAELAAQTGAKALYFARRREPACIRQERDVSEELEGRVSIEVYDDSFLHAPETVMTQSGTPYRVFTAFWKTASALGEPGLPVPAPDSITVADPMPESLSIDALGLLSASAEQQQNYAAAWVPGEAAGLQRVDDIESILRDYPSYRDRPDLDATTRLSPYLYFGEVSVRQVWHTVRQLEMPLGSAAGGEALLRQLYWRDFSSYLLFHFPDLPDKPLRSEFEHFPWSTDETLLRTWQDGMTGYPIVDAGMRQLKQTGWMHNRVRMIVASFLVKDLFVPWQDGADWFLENLVDADLANNSASWQWVAGCGSDAAPYFRIFNPTLQGQKFDPNGSYVRRWVPDVGEPSYPAPIVDHGEARRMALDAYQSIRGMRTSKQAP